MSILGLIFVVTTFTALHIYSKGGIIRDVPELGLSKLNAERGVHAKYNDRVHSYDKPFNNHPDKINVLVIGNSFARDWVNVLLESKYSNIIDISYTSNAINRTVLETREEDADIIFYVPSNRKDKKQLDIDESKLLVVGTKNFGVNSGYFYNYSGENYFEQRTLMEDGYLELNKSLKKNWGNKYLDLMAKIIDKNNTVPVFTPEKMFISQDCRHFTKAGAAYFAHLFESELASLFDHVKNIK